MAILYRANETDFTHLGLGPLNDAVSILVTEERNGIFELEMKYPVSGSQFVELKNDRLIKADAGHLLKDQRFKIIRITKPMKGIVTVYAEHISYLSKDLALKPTVAFSGNAQQALSTWKANLVDDNPFIVSSDITTTGSGKWTIDEVENPRRALGGVSGSILDVYGGEYRFDNYQIRLMRQRGVNSAALIAYGRNLTELTQEEEIANTYTSVYPYAVYNDDNNKQVLVTLPEYYIDSEYVSNFARRKILAVDFSEKEIKTVVALRSAANSYITANDIGVPKVNLKLKFIDLSKTLDYQSLSIIEEVNLCDNVPVYFEEFGINTTAKVIKVVWDDIQKHYQSIEIGEARSSLSQSITATVDGRVADVEKKVNIIQVQADGMKLIYRQVDRPPNGTNVGDLWYQPNGIYEIMYQWDGSDWKEILNTSDLDKISREVNEAISEAESAKQAAEQSYADSVAEAERLVQAQTEVFDTQMSDVNQEINTVKNNIDTTLSNVNQEIANNFTSLSDSISDVNSIANQAKADAQKGITDAATALSQAQSAISQLGGLSGKITSVENDIDEINGVLSTNVSTTEFNSLTGTVDNLSTIQTQQAGLIAQKANQSTVDTLTGRVSTAEGQITTQAGQIALRVTETQAKSIADSAVGALEIGGRNLLLNTNSKENNRISVTGFDRIYSGFAVSSSGGSLKLTVANTTSERYYRFIAPVHNNIENTVIVPGESYTFSGLYKSNFSFFIRGQSSINGGSWTINHNSVSFPTQPNWTPFKFTFVVDKNAVSFYTSIQSETTTLGSFLELKDLMLQKGNKATDWAPAPEDTIELISTVSSELSVEKDNITALLTRTGNNEIAITQVKTTADGTKTTVANHAGRLTTVETNVNGLQITVTNKADKSQITQLSDQINLRVTKGELLSQINVQADNILIQTNKLYLDVNSVHMTTAYINDIKAKSLEAVYADITKLRTQLLIANVIDATMIKTEAATINKLFATDAMVTTLTAKSAFINSIKAIDISADKITAGTLNAANVNIINLNVSSIVGLNSNFVTSMWNSGAAGSVTISASGVVTQVGDLATSLNAGHLHTINGTKTGRVDANGMQIADSNDGKTTRLHSDGLDFDWYGIKRQILQNSEGLTIKALTGSGNRLNSALYLETGAGNDKTAYLQLSIPDASSHARLQLQGSVLSLRHPVSGQVTVSDYNLDENKGLIRSGKFRTSPYDGQYLEMAERQIQTSRTGNQNIFIIPAGTGGLRVGAGGTNGQLWPVTALSFVEGSSRASKTNIVDYTQSALPIINSLKVTEYNLKVELERGINRRKIGFIAEDSPDIAVTQTGTEELGVDHYRMTALAIKSIQELTAITDKHTSDILRIDTFIGQHEQEIQQLKQKIAELERKIA